MLHASPRVHGKKKGPKPIGPSPFDYQLIAPLSV